MPWNEYFLPRNNKTVLSLFRGIFSLTKFRSQPYTGNSTFCFSGSSPRAGSKGWCYVEEENYANPDREKGWGFCSSDCYLGDYNQTQDIRILRVVQDVDALQHDLCDMFVKIAVEGQNFSLRPKVICVGKLTHWKTQVWKVQGMY
jgi:hypothetical protein